MGNHIGEIGRSYNHLIFTMGFPILCSTFILRFPYLWNGISYTGKMIFYIESGSRGLSQYKRCHLTSKGIPIIKLRSSHHHPIFMITILISGKTFFILRWCRGRYLNQWWPSSPAHAVHPINYAHGLVLLCFVVNCVVGINYTHIP